MSVGERIKEARKITGMTQAQLAENSGISSMSVRRYESGERAPDIETLQRIADALGVGISQLVPGTTRPEDDPAPLLVIPDVLKDVKVAFHRGAFEDLTQDEVDKLAEFALFVKQQRKDKEQNNPAPKAGDDDGEA